MRENKTKEWEPTDSPCGENFAKAAVFTGVGRPFEIKEFPLKEADEMMLVKISRSTVCGSDIHTWTGKRSAPLPVILGHEITGKLVAMGEGEHTDISGKPLKEGDRITWTIMSSCGQCYYCLLGLRQKCLHLFKYGHASCDEFPHLNGGFAEYIYLRKGTGIVKLPDALTDEEAVPINCALATVVNGLETISFHQGETVLIQGAGMLGLYAVSLLRERGAGKIIIVDACENRLALAEEFGADVCLNIGSLEPHSIIKQVTDMTKGFGVDLAIEVCGVPRAILQGLEMLRIGGRYLIVGMVFPNADITLDTSIFVKKILTVKGIHNYAPRHLVEAVGFVHNTKDKYSFKKLVSHTFSLPELDKAFKVSYERQVIRASVIP